MKDEQRRLYVFHPSSFILHPCCKVIMLTLTMPPSIEVNGLIEHALRGVGYDTERGRPSGKVRIWRFRC